MPASNSEARKRAEEGRGSVVVDYRTNTVSVPSHMTVHRSEKPELRRGFNEDSLEREIHDHWGSCGAHADVFASMRLRITRLRTALLNEGLPADAVTMMEEGTWQ